MNKLFFQLESLNLPKGSYAIFGSGPMCVRGMKVFNDIDLIVIPEVFEEFSQNPDWKFKDENRDLIYCDDIEMIRRWERGGWDEYKLIKEAEEIEGYPYVKLEEVLKWKKQRMMPKDLIDIEILERYLAQRHRPTM